MTVLVLYKTISEAIDDVMTVLATRIITSTIVAEAGIRNQRSHIYKTAAERWFAAKGWVQIISGLYISSIVLV